MVRPVDSQAAGPGRIRIGYPVRRVSGSSVQPIAAR